MSLFFNNQDQNISILSKKEMKEAAKLFNKKPSFQSVSYGRIINIHIRLNSNMNSKLERWF